MDQGCQTSPRLEHADHQFFSGRPGESKKTLDVNHSATPITIGFDGNYLVEFLQVIGEKSATRLSSKDANFAGLLLPESMNLEFKQQYVVMPMKAA